MTTIPRAAVSPRLALDLDQPLPDLVAEAAGQATRALPLLRLHGQPLGLVPVTLPCPAATLAGEIERVLGDAVLDHLTTDGLTWPGRVQPGVGLPDHPACHREPVATSVSVVVTAIAAGDELAGVLRGLQQQEHAPHEVIVVDNRPASSGLAQFVADWTASPVHYIAEPRPGLSRARNAGLAAASGEIVVFSDDDVVVDPGWLRALLTGFDAPDVTCVTGLILPLELETTAQQWIEQFGGFGKGFTRRRFDLGRHRDPSPLYPFNAGVFGSGANTAFRTAALRSIGGFDVHLGTGTPARGGEDLDIFLEVLAGGGAIVYEPSAVLWHAHHREVADLRRQVRGYGVGLGAAMTKRFVERPAERRQMLHRLPLGMRHLLDPGSTKNAGKTTAYPRSLTLLELAGVAQGPVAYWRSRRG